jgi:hypothetical protein
MMSDRFVGNSDHFAKTLKWKLLSADLYEASRSARAHIVSFSRPFDVPFLVIAVVVDPVQLMVRTRSETGIGRESRK